MELVKSIDDYNGLLNKARSKGKLKFSNCLFMKKDIIVLTENRNLFYKNVDSGILFFKKDGDITYLYYFLDSIENIDLSSIDGNIMIELVDRKKLNRTGPHVEEWKKNGFIKYCVNEEMIFKLSQDEKESSYSEGEEYSIGFGSLKQIEEVQKLWEVSLDKISMPLPAREELVHLIEGNQIVTILDKKNHLIGALQCSTHNGRCLLSHIVVDKDYRGKGFGSKMINYCFKQLPVQIFYLWVNEENQGAKNLYTRLGFKFSTKISIQLLKMEESK